MLLFLGGIAFLVLGYFLYGKLVEKIFGPDDRETPALKSPDGVDFVVLPRWKNMLIQLLNIAGIGPVIGVILGIKFGIIALVIIPVGCVLMGAVHDMAAGMMSIRDNGANLPKIVQTNLGKTYNVVFEWFMVILLLLVVAVFINTPAQLINTTAYLERIFEVMDEPISIDDHENAYPLPEIQGKVELKDVTFAYEKVCPIRFPGHCLPPAIRQQARWLNVYAPADPLGYPLRPLQNYAAVVHEDLALPVGPWYKRHTPLSHMEYWNDARFHDYLADYLRRLLAAGLEPAGAGRALPAGEPGDRPLAELC